MSKSRERKIRQILDGRSLLREPLEPVMDVLDETFQMSNWPPGVHADSEHHQYKHHHHSEPARFSLPMSVH